MEHPYTPIPDYTEGWPEMPVNDFKSDPTADLGYIDGLYHTAEKSMHGYWDSGETIDPNNLQKEFNRMEEKLKVWASDDVKNYLIGWGIFSFLIPLVGIVWCCCCVCCCCCCKSGFMGKASVNPVGAGGAAQMPGKTEQPQPRPRMINEAILRLALIILQGLWLFLFFLIMIYSFGGPEATSAAIEDIQKHIKNGISDADKFLKICQNQMRHMYFKGLAKFKNESMEPILNHCQDNNPNITCAQVREKAIDGYTHTEDSFNRTVNGFINTIQTIRDSIEDVRDSIDNKFEEYIVKVNKSLYWFLLLSNILLFVTFCLELGGLIMVALGRTLRQKIGGHLAIRGGLVLMFILPPYIYIQLAIIFVFGGAITQKICPQMLVVESNGTNMSQATGATYNYKSIMGNCREDQTAYYAFNLIGDSNPQGHYSKINDFRSQFDMIPNIRPGSPPPRGSVFLDPLQTADEIMYQIEHYIKEFLVEHLMNEGGKCKVGYNAIYSIVTLVCIAIPGPLLGYWYLLMYLPVLFVLMIATGLTFGYFERKRLLNIITNNNTTLMNNPFNQPQPPMNMVNDSNTLPSTDIQPDANANITKPE